MALPIVDVVQTNGNLGRVALLTDGIAALVVTGVAPAGSQFAVPRAWMRTMIPPMASRCLNT